MKVPLSLLLELEKVFPPRCIGPNETLREADRYAGKVELIEFLRAHFEQQSPDPTAEIAPAHVEPLTGVRTYDETYGDLEE